MKNESQYYIENKNRKLSELLLFFLLLLPIMVMSYAHIEESVSVIKYHFHWDIHKLIQNYRLYHFSFKSFLLKTLSFHQGNCQSGWNTAYYLLPLFTFLKIAGGLSLRNLYLFTITASIISLFLFYYWASKYWNARTAFFTTFFLGYSAVFQEFARSGSYISYSILIAFAWIIVMYICSDTKKLTPYLFLGIFTGLAMYGYGMLRGLIFVPIYILSFRKDINNKKWFLFLAGCMILILPGVILKIKSSFTGFNHKLLLLFFDGENIFYKGRFLMEFQMNIKYFFNRILGGAQLIEPLCANNHHAHFLNRILTLPFFIGLLQAIKYRREKRYNLMLMLSIFIFFVPMLLTGSIGYREARRSVLYVIPIYLYIGIGTETIFNFISSVKNRIARQISFWGIICVILVIIGSEVLYVKSFILNNTRDVGVLAFAKATREQGVKGDIYYFEPDGKDKPQFKIYAFTDLAILELALMRNKNDPFALINIRDLGEVDKGLKDFYAIIKSYVISEDEFRQLCQSHNLYSQRLVVSKLTFGSSQLWRGASRVSNNSFLILFRVSRQ